MTRKLGMVISNSSPIIGLAFENNYRISKIIYNEVLIGVGEIVRKEDK